MRLPPSPDVTYAVDKTTNGTQDFAEQLRKAADLGETWKNITKAFADCGIEHAIYMFMRPSAPHDNALVLTNLPDWWKSYYQDNQLASHDPFFKICNSFVPHRTGVEYLAENAHKLTGGERTFIREGSETGFVSGIASPVRLQNPGHFGGWNLGSSLKKPQFEHYLKHHCERLQFMGFIAHEALQRQAGGDIGPSDSKRLSVRERECLLWLARGYRSADIADRLGIAVVTVDLHFKRIRAKLHAATREESLAKAIMSGEIVP